MVEQYDQSVTNTLHCIGRFPVTNPLSLGMGGMHGTYAANMGIYESDLLINIGARFDDRLTGNLQHFAPHAKVAHIDIDPAEIGKNVPTEIPVVADARNALVALLEREATKPDHAEWHAWIRESKEKYPLWYEHSDEAISPQWLIRKIHE